MANEILLQDDFNDNSIDTAKWIESDPEGELDEINNHIEFDLNPTTEPESSLRSIITVSSGKYTMQAFLSQTPTDTINRISVGDFDEQIEIVLGFGTNIFNATGVGITGITGGKDVKIEYDFSTEDTNYYYWNGSAWINMGTFNTPLLTTRMSLHGLFAGGGGFSIAIADDAFFTNFFYTTHYPTDIPITSGRAVYTYFIAGDGGHIEDKLIHKEYRHSWERPILGQEIRFKGRSYVIDSVVPSDNPDGSDASYYLRPINPNRPYKFKK